MEPLEVHPRAEVPLPPVITPTVRSGEVEVVERLRSAVDAARVVMALRVAPDGRS
jgi:hypothetical protein